MPLFMDVHHKVDGLTAEAVAGAHQRDLDVQEQHGVKYLKYWFDEGSGKVFCLVEAPSKEAAEAVHRVVRIAARGDHRVLISDDHLLFAESMELALSLEGYDVRRLEPPEEGGSMATLRSLALRANPRTVLLDLDLGRFGDGVNLIGPLARANANVVVLTASEDVGRWGACMRLGARKVLPKTGALQHALATVRRLHQGLPVVTREELESLLEAWARDRQAHDDVRRRLDQLTPRERQVLGALTEGRTVRTIAQDSVVSEATVRTQVKSILSKLEVSSQLAAVGMANQVGWKQGA